LDRSHLKNTERNHLGRLSNITKALRETNLEVNIMLSKTILILALAVLLAGGVAAVPSVVSAGPDTEAEFDDQAPPPPPPPTTAPDADDVDSPTWRCPQCGKECPAPFGKQGRGRYGRRGGKGRGAAPGQFGRDQRRAGLPSQVMLRRATRLELSDEQITQLQKLTYGAKSKMIDLDSDLEKARLEIQQQMDTNRDDISAMKKHLDSIAKKRVSIQELKLQNWIDSKNVLTEEQKKLIGKNQLRMGMKL
jgi:Spy/CpxP family protein refolding chaperone